MATHSISIIINGKNNISNAAKSATGDINTVINAVKKANSSIAQGSQASSQALKKVGQSGGEAGKGVQSGSQQGQKSLQALTQKAGTTTSAINKVGEAGANAGKSISSGMGSAADGVGNLMTTILAGYGALEMISSAWTGSTQAQFNKAYLATKMSNEEAGRAVKTIQQIVAEVPGDDTFMNNLLTGALAKNTKLTNDELRTMANLSADYMIVSKSMGKSMVETQNDLKEYLLTGNTTQLERDSILKGQMGTLEDQETIQDRILALDKALKAEGYEGLSQLDIANIKWEEMKGRVQVVLTTIGTKLLPYVERVLDYFLQMDEKTGGLSTTLLVAAAAVGIFAAALGPVVWSFKQIFGSVSGIGKGIKNFVLPSKKKVKIDCEQDDDCKVTCDGKGGSGGVITKGSTSKGAGATTFLGGLSLIPALTGTSKATAAGMTASGWAGTALGAEILGLAYGGGMNYADTNLSGNAGYNIIRTAQLSSFGGLLRPFQAQAGLVSDLVGGKGLSASLSNYAQNMNPTKGIQDIWSNYFNVKKKIENNPITPLANTKVTLEKLGKEPQKAWEKAKKLVTGNPIVGTAKSDTKGIVNTPSIWIGAKKVIQGNPIIGKVGVKGNVAGEVYGMIATARAIINANPIIMRVFTKKSGNWNPFTGPAGPGDFISQASGGFTYESYGGTRQSVMDTIGCLSGNCVDGTLAQMSLASAFGIPSEMIATTWNGNPHVYARIGGRTRDIANHALTGSWNAPPRGPSGPGGGNVIIYGDVYGFDDFKRKVEMANNQLVRW